MRTLTEISKDVYNNRQNPRQLGNLFMELGAMYGYYSDEMKLVKVKKPAVWLGIKESNLKSDGKFLSDKMTEMKWRMTPEGQKEQEYRYLLDGIAKVSDSIKQAAYLNHQELQLDR